MVREISMSALQTYLEGARNRKAVDPTAEIEGASASRESNDSTGDELELSAQSSIAESLEKGPFYQLLGVEAKDGCICIEDIRAAYEERLGQFTAEVSGRLREAGVDMSQEFTLRSDSAGRVYVAGDHPDKEKIEAVFDNDPDLSNRFRGFSATASFLQAAEEAAPFHEAYAKDPYGAVDRYSYLFDDTRQSIFNLHFGEDGAEDYITRG